MNLGEDLIRSFFFSSIKNICKLFKFIVPLLNFENLCCPLERNTKIRWQYQHILEPFAYYKFFWRHVGSWQNSEHMSGHSGRATDHGST